MTSTKSECSDNKEILMKKTLNMKVTLMGNDDVIFDLGRHEYVDFRSRNSTIPIFTNIPKFDSESVYPSYFDPSDNVVPNHFG
ncbi:hypothetical protein GCK72_013256 [Caenorhabditis remanei]|uniref:Uncharacterized protein n=1 Tax=Caenorhabditis remanei TaxID=31234 RepID=A0A6A5GR01_CAERE|nr:hypothetical protein GCK72_013256 [Caenorhabditis remanei]KAF1756802.1 hypothetical protein GCK72_013256 [Caenorhabditis remanei]